MNIDKSFQLAVGYYQTGKLPEAESLCRQIIRKQPKHVDALNLLGLVCYDLTSYDSAIEYIKKALELNPSNAEAYTNLGNAYKKKRQLDKAVTSYERAIKLKPSLAMAHNNLGSVFQEKGRLDEAVNCYQRAIKLNPNLAMAYNNLGVTLIEKGQLDEAISCYQKAIILNPNFTDTYYNLGVVFQKKGQLDEAISYYQKAQKLNPQKANIYFDLGNVLKDQGKMDEAITHYQKALQLDPNYVLAYYKLGNVLKDQGKMDEAIICYQKAIELNPSFAEAYCNLGAALQEKGQLDEAVTHCLKAIELNPSFAKAHCNLGVALQEKGQLDEAVTHYQKAIELSPSFVEAYCNLGVVLKEKGQLDESIIYYQKALEINPESETAKFNMSLPLLLTGQFKEGWEKYEQRWKAKVFLRKSGFHEPGEFSQPAWDGTSLEGKSIFIYSEQGIGDEIMFASCLHEVIDEAHECIVECDKRLVPIFVRSFPKAIFIERVKETDTCSSELPQADVVIPSGSLPKFLRTEFGSFPGKRYLIPGAEKVQSWRDRLKTLGDGLKVGISWRGGAIPGVRRKRSIELEHWAKLFSLSGLKFINLQYGDCKDELKEVKEKYGITIHDWEDADPLKDLDHFTAEIAALDLILSVDNSAVHMAGALGKPAWVLLPFIPDWRWMLDREDSPWYPTVRLFRQPSNGDWESVIAMIAVELQKRLLDDK